MKKSSQATSTTVKRTCPICYEYGRIKITLRGSWEIWECQQCGCRKDYQLSGRVN